MGAYERLAQDFVSRASIKMRAKAVFGDEIVHEGSLY
jgi:hypothetical protein